MSEQKPKNPLEDILNALSPWGTAAQDVAQELQKEAQDAPEKIADLLEWGAKAMGVVRDVDDATGMVVDIMPCPKCGGIVCTCGAKLV